MIKLSHTSMSCYRRCRYKYYLKYMDNYVEPSGQGQIMGSIGHAGLAHWYQTGNEESSLKVAFQRLLEITPLRDEGGYDEDTWDKAEQILKRYFRWSVRNDDFNIELYQDKPAMELKVETEIGGYIIQSIIDGFVFWNNSTWILEHKFMAQVRTGSLDLDPQVSLYLLVARKLGFEPRGVLYNVVRTAIGGVAENNPVVRMPTFRNQEALDVIEKELALQASEMEQFLDGKGVSIYRNTTKDCSWDCGFFKVCLSINDNGDAQSVLSGYEKVSLEEELVDVEASAE